MTEITAREKPRTFVPRSGSVFFINHPDFLLVLHKECGGCVSIIGHVPSGKVVWMPIVKQCKCETKHGE